MQAFQSYLLLLFLLLSTCHSANVLVIAGIRGSHLHFSQEVAGKLVKFGHNFTVLTMYSDKKADVNDTVFKVITFGDEKFVDPFFKGWDAAMERFLHHPSPDMVTEFVFAMVHVDQAKEWTDEHNRIAVDYFTGDKFSKLLDTGKFDLIVVEDSISYQSSGGLANRDIPIMGLVCTGIVKDLNLKYNLPGLLNSEPSTVNDVTDSSPTFVERLQTLRRISRLLRAFVPFIHSFVKHIKTAPGKSLDDYFLAPYDVVFINEHPAFSFPYVSPPNMFYLAPFNLENRPTNSLPEDYTEFLNNCPYRHLVLLSFGSYIRNITKFSGTPVILQTLRHMDVCVIVSNEVDLSKQFDLPNNKFFQRSWIPQRDLLGSGKLDFFISHCGNHGRLEAIYYSVPLLCVPLWSDQYYYARLVERNGFGVLLTWETLTEESLTRTVDKLVSERDTFVANMRRATDIARNDPGSGTEVLRFYTDLLIRNGKSDYLVNKIILNQSSNEIYNIDMAAIALILTFCLLVGISYCLVKLFYLCHSKIMIKAKSD